MPVRHAFKNISLQQLKRIFRLSLEANNKQTNDVTALSQEHHYYSRSRRRFLTNAAKLTALAGVSGLYNACAPANKKTQPSIAIIGAGIAGLHAAYILKQAGYTSYVYEASGRVGGRIHSVDNIVGD